MILDNLNDIPHLLYDPPPINFSLLSNGGLMSVMQIYDAVANDQAIIRQNLLAHEAVINQTIIDSLLELWEGH